MVAAKKGRGGAQKKNVKSNENVNPTEPQAEVVEAVAEDNGEAQAENASADAVEQHDEADQTGAEVEQETTEEMKPEEGKEEKVETGKLLVENLPSSFLFDYQDKLKDLFSKHGEINNVKRGPIIVTELTTTPTLSAIVEFKNKESLEKALTENGTVLDGNAISVTVESSAETAILVGVPYEASIDYVKLLFSQCGEVVQIQEFSKTKFKILRVNFQLKESVERALKLDRELRLNGFHVTVSRYREDDVQKGNANKGNKRQHGGGGGGGGGGGRNNNSAAGANPVSPARNNSYRARSNAPFNARGNYRGGSRGRGYSGRGGAFPRGGFAPVNSYLPPQPYGPMARPGAYMDGQRPNKRLRQM